MIICYSRYAFTETHLATGWPVGIKQLTLVVYLRSKSYYALHKKHGSVMQVVFLDAWKAFDLVNVRKLLPNLESRGVPTYILRLLSNELIGQYT